MGVIFSDNIIMCGNFEEVQPEMPKDLHYDRDAKWVEPYKMEWREILGNAICSCTEVEVHFAPYHGFDHYHQKTCSLMRKLKAEPQIENLREVYLPQMTQYDDSKANDGKRHIWVENKSKRSKNIKVRVKIVNKSQMSLIERV